MLQAKVILEFPLPDPLASSTRMQLRRLTDWSSVFPMLRARWMWLPLGESSNQVHISNLQALPDLVTQGTVRPVLCEYKRSHLATIIDDCLGFTCTQESFACGIPSPACWRTKLRDLDISLGRCASVDHFKASETCRLRSCP